MAYKFFYVGKGLTTIKIKTTWTIHKTKKID